MMKLALSLGLSLSLSLSLRLSLSLSLSLNLNLNLNLSLNCRDVDMRLARLERLMDRRPELLSSVLLRQNPHSVQEWIKRAALFEGTPAKVSHEVSQSVSK